MTFFYPTAGTLLWVGSRHHSQSKAAFEFCERHVAQIAYRRDAADALARPAAGVDRWINFHSQSRLAHDGLIDHLRSVHPAAPGLILRSTLCSGDPRFRRGPAEPMLLPACDALATLPSWLGLTGRGATAAAVQRLVIGVVSRTAANAEALMDLADECGATAFWLRHPGRTQIRNLDQCWWDDSAAPADEADHADQADQTDQADRWRDRIAAMTPVASRWPVRHVWWTSTIDFAARHAATRAGIDTIVTKPGSIEPFLALLGAGGRLGPLQLRGAA